MLTLPIGKGAVELALLKLEFKLVILPFTVVVAIFIELRYSPMGPWFRAMVVKEYQV